MKKIIIVLVFVFAGLGFISVPNAHAAPAPYTGGAAVAKVLYPADGSTVTITVTGAVIKQSSGHTAYREGWIDPCNIGSVNTASDLQGQIKPGSSNPYAVNAQHSIQGNCTNNGSNGGSQSSSSSTPAPTTTSSSSNATANANATANVVAASQPAAAQTSVVTTAATPTSSTTQSQSSSSNGKGATLPNTGPSDVLPAFGISTILGTAGHYLFTRRRDK